MAEINKDVFDYFFNENYCELQYSDVKQAFENVADLGLDELFTDDTDITAITRKNFIVHMRGDIYGMFEEIVEETANALNSEIADAVMDVGSTMNESGDITETYWDTNEKLVTKFLQQLYDERISKMIAEL